MATQLEAAPTAARIFTFDNSYARELDGAFVPVEPAHAPAPRMLKLNRALAAELGADVDALVGELGAQVLSGNVLPAGATPIAQVYAGHQFGGFSPQLGDGRALLLGEVIDAHGQRRDIAFKGSGRTKFSRGGDGKSALGPVVREYIIGEAMHALGIPTSRALAAVATGETVYRETPLPGGVLTRVAASHLRVGTFEFFAARGDTAMLKRLAEYTIARHYPDLAARDDRFVALLGAVAERQAALIAQWMSVGFIHGVMNTDNMALSGESIDFGPCAFMDAYDPRTVFSSIDSNGRYAYGNQPFIANWNLARFAETLLPLIDDDSKQAVALATPVIHAFPERYARYFSAILRIKLGLDDLEHTAEDEALIESFLKLLETQRVDFTQTFRRVADAADCNDAPLQSLFDAHPALGEWLARWRVRRAASARSPRDTAASMRAVNPIYIPRNHLVEAAIAAVVNDADSALFERLLDALSQPYTERDAFGEYALPAPLEYTEGYQTFCGT
jgi:serine/tyrosine/threonine adenylyltransferase